MHARHALLGRSRRSSLAQVFFSSSTALLVAVAGCGSDAADGGPPQLKKAIVVAPNSMDEPDLLAAAPDGGMGAAAAAYTPMASLKLVFSQLLDGNKIESILDGGAIKGKTDVVSLTWMSAPAGAPAISAVTTYNPTGALGPNLPGPSVRVAADPGLPSGAMIQVKLDRTKITSKGGAQFQGTDTLMLATLPLVAEVSVQDGETVAPEFTLKVAFSNVPGDGVAQHIRVTGAGGANMGVDVAPDPMDHRVLVVKPSGGATVWQNGGYVVRVSKDAADLFGVTLGADLMVNFTVSRTTPDAGGGGGADAAGGADAGATDGGASG